MRIRRAMPNNAGVFFEALEQRTLLAAVMWDGSAGTPLWMEPLNWSTDQVPGPDDDVTIPDTALQRIQLIPLNPFVPVTTAVRSLVTAERISIGLSATLDVGTTVQASANITLEGGVLRGGDYSFSGGAAFVITNATQNRVQDIALNADVVLDNGAFLGVLGQLTLPAGARFRFTGSTGSRLFFEDAYTVNRDVSFESTSSNRSALGTLSGGVITIAPGVTVAGANAVIGLTFAPGMATSVINNGTIRSTVGGRLITIDPSAPAGGSATFVNNGSLAVTNGGRLTALDVAGNAGLLSVTGNESRMTITGAAPFVLGGAIVSAVSGSVEIGGDFVIPAQATISVAGAACMMFLGTTAGSWSSAGSIQVSSGAFLVTNSNSLGWSNQGSITLAGSLYIRGVVATGGLGNIINSGNAQVRLQGTLDNTDAVLTIDESRAQWRIQNGTVRGGTVSLTAPGALLFTGASPPEFWTGTLDGVTLTHDLVLHSSMTIEIRNGITLPPGGRFLLPDNTRSTIGFQGTSVTIPYDVDLGTDGRLAPATGGATFTIPAGVTVSSRSGTIGDGASPFTLVNHGTIRAVAQNGNRSFAIGAFGDNTIINHGLIEAVAGGRFFCDGDLLNESAGIISIRDAGTFGAGGGSGGVAAFDNRGSITALGGSSLSLHTHPGIGFSNTGAVTLQSSTLTFTGTVRPDELGNIQATLGGGVILRGVLDNAGQTLVLNPTTGPWTVDGGTISGGTVAPSHPSLLRFTGNTANLLLNATLASDLQLDNGAFLQTIGATFSPGSVIRFTGVAGSSLALGNTTLANDVFFESTGTTPSLLGVRSSSQALSIGAGVTISGGNAILGRARLETDARITNNGTIRATVPGRPLIVDINGSNPFFANNGLVEAIPGAALLIADLNNLNGTTRVLTGGTYRAVAGSTLSLVGGGPIRGIGPGTTISLTGAAADLAGAPFAALESNQGSIFLAGGKELTVTPVTGTFTNGGVLDIDPASHLVVARPGATGGNFTQSVSGALRMRLGITTPTGGPAFVQAAGVATLAGSLSIAREPLFAPTAGATYQLVAATSRTGVFSNVTLSGYLGLPGFASLEYATGADLLIGPTSPDFNGDGRLDPDDLSDFITAFFLDVQFPGMFPQADFNGDGFRDPDDLSDFIAAFFLG